MKKKLILQQLFKLVLDVVIGVNVLVRKEEVMMAVSAAEPVPDSFLLIFVERVEVRVYLFLRESSSSGRFRDEGYTLRVSSIGDEAKEADIMDLFREFGRVLRCYVSQDRVTMESRIRIRYIFRKEDADRALKTMDGRPYGYMVLHVEYANHQNVRSRV